MKCANSIQWPTQSVYWDPFASNNIHARGCASMTDQYWWRSNKTYMLHCFHCRYYCNSKPPLIGHLHRTSIETPQERPNNTWGVVGGYPNRSARLPVCEAKKWEVFVSISTDTAATHWVCNRIPANPTRLLCIHSNVVETLCWPDRLPAFTHVTANGVDQDGLYRGFVGWYKLFDEKRQRIEGGCSVSWTRMTRHFEDICVTCTKSYCNVHTVRVRIII